MPTNLPPDALEAEKRYRAAETLEDRIVCLEEFIGLIPKHKGTDHLRADLRRQLSKLKASAQSGKKGARQDSAFHIVREGAGQVAIVGMTNVGKSALVAALTNATPEVSDAPYTTWEPTPGMMLVDNVQVQLIDTPPLSREYVEPELLNLIRRSDLILLVVDVQTQPIQQLEESIAILEEHRIVPLHRKGSYPEDPRFAFKPLLVLANRCDDQEAEELFEILTVLLESPEGSPDGDLRDPGGRWPILPVSATTGYNLEQLKRVVFDMLAIIRVYAKPPGKDPDFSRPYVLPRGSTVEEFARKIHKDFYDNLKAARVWGSAAFDGQAVSRDHVLRDGDVVELRI
ncbi:MAG: TGS domain-containing protein [Anaerolineae bacterium]|nr:TGS domain-containing protein [Anaerolineae bacterium]